MFYDVYVAIKEVLKHGDRFLLGLDFPRPDLFSRDDP
jgi:hypothetical protein